MPQEFQVLRCYQCSTFQVHQVKKSNKWVCKICAEKQSIKRNYGTGTGKECRLHVQKLNSIRGETMTSEILSETIEEYGCNSSAPKSSAQLVTKSKWEQFLQNDTNIDGNSRLIPNFVTDNSDSELESAFKSTGHSRKQKKLNLGKLSHRQVQRDIRLTKENISCISENNFTTIQNRTEECNSKMKFGSTSNINLPENTCHVEGSIDHLAPKLLNDSKWKQFVEVEPETEAADSLAEASVIEKTNADFFALDEENIDEILNSF